jgi:hypothetical protein
VSLFFVRAAAAPAIAGSPAPLHVVFSSLYLFKLGLAPQIQDLYGKVDFTGKELQTWQEMFDLCGK